MRHYLLVGMVSSIALASAAHAQTSVQDPQIDQASGDIIVTATRNQSLASKTPVALTAVTGETLRDTGITNPTALAEQVPSVSIDRNNNGLQITIRGVTSSDLSEKGDPSAAFLLDGIYIARAQAQEVSFFDIARVEVLRGPQGTLYGRNTTAGLVNVITNRPSAKFEASGDAAFGNYGTYQASGMINLPVSSMIAVRGSFNYDRRDSFLVAGPRLTADISPFKENISGRLQALLKWDSGDLLIRGDYSDIGGKTLNTLPLTNFYSDVNIIGSNPIYIGGNEKAVRTNNAPIGWDLDRNNSTWGIGAELNWDLGPVALSYLGAYREFSRKETGVSFAFNGSNAFRTEFDGDYWQNSQELRLSTTGDGPLKVQGGLYYFKEKSAIGFYILGSVSPTPGTTGYAFGFPQDPTIAESWGSFVQGTYSVTDTLRLTGGIRYSEDDKSRVGFTVRCGAITCAAPTDIRTPNIAQRKFSKTTWRAGLDWDLDTRTLVYGVVSTGYKAGGFNDGCIAGTGPGCAQVEQGLYYDPETLTAYEGGVKTRFLDNAIHLNVSAFYYDYKGIQLSQLADICGGPCTVTTNAGKAEVSGVEVEGVIVPGPNTKVDFQLAYLDAKYTEFRPRPTIDWEGLSLDRSPRWTISGGVSQTIPLANGGDFVAAVRTRLSDSYKLAALATVNQYRQPSFTKTDFILTYNAPDQPWYLQGFLKNIENALVVTTVGGGATGNLQIGDPRTYGVRAGFKF